jgi:hypothetical protein
MQDMNNGFRDGLLPGNIPVKFANELPCKPTFCAFDAQKNKNKNAASILLGGRKNAVTEVKSV